MLDVEVERHFHIPTVCLNEAREIPTQPGEGAGLPGIQGMLELLQLCSHSTVAQRYTILLTHFYISFPGQD